jgi:hypothetical protein
MKYLFYMFIMLKLVVAQSDTAKSIAIDSLIIVDIDLNGIIIIENSPDNFIHLRSESKTDGKVIGFSNRDKIAAYSLETKISDNTLLISAHPREKSWVIGINTLVEENTHYIHIPGTMNVTIHSKDAQIHVNGIFSLLKIDNQKGDTDLRIAEAQLHYLTAGTKNGEIWLNNSEQQNEYSIISGGVSIVDISSYSGSIKLEMN